MRDRFSLFLPQLDISRSCKTAHPLFKCQVASEEYGYLTRRTYQSREENCRGVGEGKQQQSLQMPERDQGMWFKLASQVFKQMGNAKIKAHKKPRESRLEWGVPLE